MKTYWVATLLILLALLSCDRVSQSSVNFKDDFINDNYSVQVPSFLTKVEEGYWSKSSDKNIFKFNVTVLDLESSSLEDILMDQVLLDEDEKTKNKSFVRKEDIAFENFTGKYIEYEVNHSTGVVPVISRHSYSVLQDGYQIIKIKFLSLGNDDMAYAIPIIKSIKRVGNDNSYSKEGQDNKVLDTIELKKKGYQVFVEENFVIKYNCKFDVNWSVLEAAKSQGRKGVTYAYQCTEKDKFNNDAATIYINVEDLSNTYLNIAKGSQATFEKEFLDIYKNNFYNAGADVREGEYLDVRALEYSFTGESVEAQAIFFIKNKKSYLLQVNGKNNVSEKLDEIKSSFKLINS